jgi:TPP-dependent 2-oxoacid decarboxylase
MAATKSFFPEQHPQFAGIYWGEVSASGAREIFDWSDSVMCIGTIFNDYSTVGWTAMPSGPKVLTADKHRVYFEGHDFGHIHLSDFLETFARRRGEAAVQARSYCRGVPLFEPRLSGLSREWKLNRARERTIRCAPLRVRAAEPPAILNAASIWR